MFCPCVDQRGSQAGERSRLRSPDNRGAHLDAFSQQRERRSSEHSLSSCLAGLLVLTQSSTAPLPPCQALGFQQRSLGCLLQRYCGAEADKSLQQADWRQRCAGASGWVRSQPALWTTS